MHRCVYLKKFTLKVAPKVSFSNMTKKRTKIKDIWPEFGFQMQSESVWLVCLIEQFINH